MSDSTIDSGLQLTKEEIEVFGLLSSGNESDDELAQIADASGDEIEDMRLRMSGAYDSTCGSERKDDEDCEVCSSEEEEDCKKSDDDGKELERASYQNDILLFRLKLAENNEA